MTQLVWNRPEDRNYEYGVDRGVVYPSFWNGQVWNGLISIEEQFSDATVSSSYFDGVKYHQKVSGQAYRAVARAYSAPPELSYSEGNIPAIPGFILTRQPRQRFDLTYRTRVNEDHYKIHLVYNVLAVSNNRSRSTLKATSAPTVNTWQLTAAPVDSTIRRPAAHYILDSRKIDPDMLLDIENVLYGTDSTPPRLPQPNVIWDMTSVILEPMGEPI